MDTIAHPPSRIIGPNQKSLINSPWYPAVHVQRLRVLGVHDLYTKVIQTETNYVQTSESHHLAAHASILKKSTRGSKPRLSHICLDLNDIVCVVQSCFHIYIYEIYNTHTHIYINLPSCFLSYILRLYQSVFIGQPVLFLRVKVFTKGAREQNVLFI